MKKTTTPEPISNPRFEKIRDEVIAKQMATNGIGTLSEKTIHAVLKSYYAKLPEYEEVRRCGFVADVCCGFEITEIQTRQFYKCKRKLDAFLPEHEVTMVYPLAAIKWLRWIDPETGKISAPRKSTARHTPFMIFPELYSIREYLLNPHLHFMITALEVEEYKYLDGYGPQKKIRATRSDGFPVNLLHEYILNEPKDFMMFLPIELPDEFTSLDFAKCAKINRSLSQTTLNVLTLLGIVTRIGKQGRSILYRINE